MPVGAWMNRQQGSMGAWSGGGLGNEWRVERLPADALRLLPCLAWVPSTSSGGGVTDPTLPSGPRVCLLLPLGAVGVDRRV